MSTKRTPSQLDGLELLTVDDVALRIGISTTPIRRAIRTGALRTINLGTPDRKKLRIRPADLLDWLDREAARSA